MLPTEESKTGDERMGKETMGSFIAQLRHENELTQKELAARLHVTDKAVSKWECGQSYPDIELLEPMAAIFRISITELIQGGRLPQPDGRDSAPIDANQPDAMYPDTTQPDAVTILLAQATEQVRKYKRKDFSVCIIGIVISLILIFVLPAMTVFVNKQVWSTYDVTPIIKYYILRTIVMLLVGIFIALLVKKTSHSLIINILEFVCVFLPALYLALIFVIYMVAPQLVPPVLLTTTNMGALSAVGCIITGAYIFRFICLIRHRKL